MRILILVTIFLAFFAFCLYLCEQIRNEPPNPNYTEEFVERWSSPNSKAFIKDAQ